MDRIIDIATDGRHLSRERGFLKISEEGSEIGRISLDEIISVIIHAHGTTISGSLLAKLGDLGVPVVFCASKKTPGYPDRVKRSDNPTMFYCALINDLLASESKTAEWAWGKTHEDAFEELTFNDSERLE